MKLNSSELSCPACGNAMRFIGFVLQSNNLPRAQRFKCTQCCLVVSGEAAAEVLEMVLWRLPISNASETIVQRLPEPCRIEGD
jgi:hypothetical protein